MKNISLKYQFTDWVEMEIACELICKYFGIIDYDSTHIENKWVYHSSNKVSEPIYSLIFSLIDVGFLEKDELGLKVRYNSKFSLEDIGQEV